MVLSSDPWSWTENDLVVELCHSTSLFEVTGCSLENYPDTAKLEVQIREQEITGRTLLSALNSDILRNELGIRNLDQRLALLQVIDFLRRQSLGYSQHISIRGSANLQVDNSDTTAPSQSSSRPVSRIAPNTNQSDSKRQKITHVTEVARPAVLPVHGSTQGTDPEEWNWLLKWQEVDEAVPDEESFSPEDLSDQDQYDEADIVDEDPQQPLADTEEVEESTVGSCKLSTDVIAEIINERIEYYANTWVPNKGLDKDEQVDYDPQEMWEKAEATSQRLILVEKHKREAEYYAQRLDDLCEKIAKYPGGTANSVRGQCRNLEVTIHQLELAEWLLSIYSLDPVHDSEDEALHSRSPSVEGNVLKPQPRIEPATLGLQRAPVIIDLDAPTSTPPQRNDTSSIGGASLPTGHADRPSQTRGLSTPNSVILDTVKLPQLASFEGLTSQHVSLATSQVHLSNQPESASVASVRRWKWQDLVWTRDRKRVVSKVVYEMSNDSREMIRIRLGSVSIPDIIREISAYVTMLSRGESKMQGVLPRDLLKIMIFARLFLCWWLCDNYFQLQPLVQHLQELAQYLQQGSPDPGVFCDYLNKIMETTFNPEALKNPDQPSQTEIIEISSDEDSAPPLFATQRNSTV